MATYRVRGCDHCGNQFAPTSSKSKFCSASCRFKAIAVKFADKSGCWEWPLSLNVATGYGQFTAKPAPNQVLVTAHRFSYETFNGAIPDGYCVMHKCDNRKCFNPDHLSVGTLTDNNQDMTRKGRHWASSHKPVTTCKRGHDKTLTKDGRFRCLACESSKRRSARVDHQLA